MTKFLAKDPLPTKTGTQKIWWDVSGNRFFALVDRPKPLESKGILELFDPYLSILDIKEIPVIEIDEALKIISKT